MTSATLRLRAMQPDDLPAVMAIEERVFIGDAWPESFYRRDLNNPQALYYVLELIAEDATRHLLGYAGCWFIEDEAHLMTIAVAPEWQGRGLGAWLLLSVLDLVEARGATVCTLEVRVSNLRAQVLYQRVGFEVTGRRRRYYQDNREDALIMTTPPLASPAMRDLRRQRQAEVAKKLAQVDADPSRGGRPDCGGISAPNSVEA